MPRPFQADHSLQDNLAHNDVERLSHDLSRVLRHKALKRGIKMTQDGYAKVLDVLHSLRGPQRWTEQHVRFVVETSFHSDSQPRFEILENPHGDGKTWIRALRHHSIAGISVNPAIRGLGAESTTFPSTSTYASGTVVPEEPRDAEQDLQMQNWHNLSRPHVAPATASATSGAGGRGRGMHMIAPHWEPAQPRMHNTEEWRAVPAGQDDLPPPPPPPTKPPENSYHIPSPTTWTPEEEAPNSTTQFFDLSSHDVIDRSVQGWALAEFHGSEYEPGNGQDHYLCFRKGDRLSLIRKGDEQWSMGETDQGDRGWFPSEYWSRDVVSAGQAEEVPLANQPASVADSSTSDVHTRRGIGEEASLLETRTCAQIVRDLACAERKLDEKEVALHECRGALAEEGRQAELHARQAAEEAWNSERIREYQQHLQGECHELRAALQQAQHLAAEETRQLQAAVQARTQSDVAANAAAAAAEAATARAEAQMNARIQEGLRVTHKALDDERERAQLKMVEHGRQMQHLEDQERQLRSELQEQERQLRLAFDHRKQLQSQVRNQQLQEQQAQEAHQQQVQALEAESEARFHRIRAELHTAEATQADAFRRADVAERRMAAARQGERHCEKQTQEARNQLQQLRSWCNSLPRTTWSAPSGGGSRASDAVSADGPSSSAPAATTVYAGSTEACVPQGSASASGLNAAASPDVADSVAGAPVLDESEIASCSLPTGDALTDPGETSRDVNQAADHDVVDHAVASRVLRPGGSLPSDPLRSPRNVGHAQGDRKRGADSSRIYETLHRVYVSNNGPEIMAESRERTIGTEETEVPVGSLFFSHDSISKNFSHGKHKGTPVTELVAQLNSGTVTPQEPSLRLQAVKFNGRMFCLNNRRLYALREHQRNCRAQVRVRVLVYELDAMTAKFVMAYTTENSGNSVSFRKRGRNCTAGDDNLDHSDEDEESDGESSYEDVEEGDIEDGHGVVSHATCDQAVQTEADLDVLEGDARGEAAIQLPVQPNAAGSPTLVNATADLLSCSHSEEFPFDKFPEFWNGLEDVLEYEMQKDTRTGQKDFEDEDRCFKKFYHSLVTMPKDSAQRRLLDAIKQKDKETVRSFLVQVKEDRRLQARRVDQVIKELSACREWHATFSAQTPEQISRETSAADAFVGSGASNCAQRPARPKPPPPPVPVSAQKERAAAAAEGRIAAAASRNRGDAGCHAGAAASESDVARTLSCLREFCERSCSQSESGVQLEETFKQIKLSVTQWARRFRADPTYCKHLEALPNKTEFLEFIVDFASKRKYYKAQAEQVLQALDTLRSWREAVLRLPSDVSEQHRLFMEGQPQESVE